jgi:flagellar motor component MotA
MRLKYAIGVVLLFAIAAGLVLVSGGKMMIFIDVPTIVVILVAPAVIAFMSWPVKDVGRAFSAPFDATASRAELEKSALFFAALRKWIYIAAFLGSMMGLICILALTSKDGTDRLSRNLAVMLLCIVHALFLDLLVPLPLESLARRRLAELER